MPVGLFLHPDGKCDESKIAVCTPNHLQCDRQSAIVEAYRNDTAGNPSIFTKRV